MPIVNFTKNKADAPENAVFDNHWQVWIWKTHEGLCVKEREANYYDDSDFYMTVYNPEKEKFEEICFASTRGWTYPALGSSVDATEKVMQKYNSMVAYRQRCAYVMGRRAVGKAVWRACDEMNINRVDYRKLKTALSSYEFCAVERLLKTKKFRSEFRQSLANQVRAWLNSESQFNKPLSPKQMNKIY